MLGLHQQSSGMSDLPKDIAAVTAAGRFGDFIYIEDQQDWHIGIREITLVHALITAVVYPKAASRGVVEERSPCVMTVHALLLNRPDLTEPTRHQLPNLAS